MGEEGARTRGFEGGVEALMVTSLENLFGSIKQDFRGFTVDFNKDQLCYLNGFISQSISIETLRE